MRIEILKVDHGFCALLTSDNERRILIDCGHSSLTGLRPSTLLAARGIHTLDALIVSHADEDHISDLPNILKSIDVRSVVTNDSLDPGTLWRIKTNMGAIGPAAHTLIWRKIPSVAKIMGDAPFPWLAHAEITLYRNRFPDFTDLNNLSLVTFVHYGNIHAIFPGDLEVAGWQALLRDPYFRAELSRVNVFVASHHGRENGFCSDVFSFCTPELVIISDGRKQHASQEMVNRYAYRALGVHFGLEHRRVLSTRCDGTIFINQSHPANRRALVTTGRYIHRALQWAINQRQKSFGLPWGNP